MTKQEVLAWLIGAPLVPWLVLVLFYGLHRLRGGEMPFPSQVRLILLGIGLVVAWSAVLPLLKIPAVLGWSWLAAAGLAVLWPFLPNCVLTLMFVTGVRGF